MVTVNSLFRFNIGLLFLILTAGSSYSAPPTMEIQNKQDQIFVKIQDGGKFLPSSDDCNKVKKEGTREFSPNLTSETKLFIYKVSPCGDTGLPPFKVYKFTPGKTIYVTWNNDTLYPQTGPGKGITGKTKTGWSLSKNVTASKKQQSDIIDFTELYRIQNDSAKKLDQAADAPKKAVASLNEMWKQRCDPQASGGPSQPNSLFCAAGWGNPFAMLMLRTRFVIPTDAKGLFQPRTHMLKLVGNKLPEPDPSAGAMAVNPKELYFGFFEKIEEQEVVKWEDFDAFIQPVKINVALGKFIDDIMRDYGLSIDSSVATQDTRIADAKRIEVEAKKAIPGVTFPMSSVFSNSKRLDLDQLFQEKCPNGGSWSRTLFCSMGEGGASANYFGQIAFAKPKDKELHAIKILLKVISDYAEGDQEVGQTWTQWLTGAVGLPAVRKQLKDAILKVQQEAENLTWEDLRYSLVVGKWFASKDVTEWVPAYAANFLKEYGLEIAP